MGARFRAADAVRREQAVPAHEAPDPPGGGADAGVAQPGPDLAVALAVQARGQDLPADVQDQLGGVGAGADRATAGRAGRCRRIGRRTMAVDRIGRRTMAVDRIGRRTMAVDRGAGEPPDAGDPGHAAAPAGDRGDGPAHRLGLRRPKGRVLMAPARKGKMRLVQ
jgi:hypothetical protein